MQGDIYRFSTVKCDGRQILVKERLEHDDFISMFQESREDRVLPCALWLMNKIDAKKILGKNAFVSPACDKDFGISI